MHNNEFCTTYNEKALPDENNNCSLCGKMLADIVFENDEMRILRLKTYYKHPTLDTLSDDHLIYRIEPKGSVDYRTYEQQNAVRIITSSMIRKSSEKNLISIDNN
jgi:hypothetical protein